MAAPVEGGPVPVDPLHGLKALVMQEHGCKYAYNNPFSYIYIYIVCALVGAAALYIDLFFELHDRQLPWDRSGKHLKS